MKDKNEVVQSHFSNRERLYETLAKDVVIKLLDGQEITPVLIEEMIPLIKTSDWLDPPFYLSICLLCPFRSDVSKFFQEMISKWLVPGSLIPIESFFTSKFKFFELEKDAYLISEATVFVKNAKTLDVMNRNFSTLVREIKLGLRSRFHAKRLLEIKGISNSEKTVQIQERIAHLVSRFPHMFDYDIFSLMQRYLITVSDEYMQMRSHRILAHIICMIYRFLTRLSELVEKTPRKRHIFVRLTRTTVETPFGLKRVLGVFVGLNLLKDNEVFDKRHLKKAVERFFPNVSLVDGSYFLKTKEAENILSFYVEIEKEGEIPFSDNEINQLRLELADHLKGCIESLVRPVFMPRNEEEVMKYIVTLSAELDLVKDIPQIVIIFDEQTDRDLFFTVIIARIVLPDSMPIEDLFVNVSPMLEVTIERVRQLGVVRKKFPKEVAVLRIRLSNTPFLRDDFAVDLYRARERVVRLLREVLGDVRDYNGGMISKQMEVFLAFKETLSRAGGYSEHVLEVFFHSLYPTELRAVTRLDCLGEFYRLFEGLRLEKEERLGFVESQKIDEQRVYWCGKFSDQKQAKNLLDHVLKMQIPTPQLVRLFLPVQEVVYVGFIFFSDSEAQQKIFLDEIMEHLQVEIVV